MTGLQWLRERIRGFRPEPVVRTSKDRERLSPWEMSQAQIGKCPDCGGALLEGPCGGCSVNVCCASCSAKYNLGFGFGSVVFGERISDSYRDVQHAMR